MKFFKSSYTDSFCSLLGCKDGRGYTGSGDGECFSVTRCTKCKTASAFESSMAYCSVIPTIKGEITLFQGFLKASKSGKEILNSSTYIDESQETSESNEQKTEDSEGSQDYDYNDDEDDDESDESDGEGAAGTNRNYSNENISMSTSNLKGGSEFSLLELVSQMTESESDEENENLNNLTKSNKSRSKGLFSKIFSRKKKRKPEESQATQFKKTNRFSFNLNSLKNKFRDKNGSNKLNLSSKYSDKSTVNQKLKSAQISKGTTIEWEASGSVLSERLNKCTVIDGLVPLTVHTFLQYYNVKNRSRVGFKKNKFAAFQFMVDSKIDSEEICRKPSNFIGRLTTRQKLVTSNSISVPIGIFKSNGISGVISSIKAKYTCKSPKCFPKQYYSCIKITCALNQADLQNQKWRKIQSENIEERKREIEKNVSNELENFREFVAETQGQSNNEENTEIQSNKMNGPLSFTDDIQQYTNENTAYQIENVKDLEESQGDKKENLDNHGNTNEAIKIETKKEEEIIDAPSDEKRSSSLVERLKRSLGAPAEELTSSNAEESDTEDNSQEGDEDIPFQPEITINDKIENPQSNLKNIIYVTLGITCTVIIIIGTICIV
ncbi:putative integral membrane protein [Cryptosporidium meleagridis]|uniref:Putative integral membrane protein n=1 Tax=Cryptosporidium meleagridis TaxID=93969 RepID=A0A2P4Z3Y9_9CRYT|nr:putative integral membrane protein [Cryptosporidium meleagridis]